MNFLSSSKQSGVTLLELVLVIVTVGILTVPIASGFKTLGQGFGLNRELQMSAAIAQECAEHVLQISRNGNIGTLTNSTCDNDLPAIPALTEFSTITRGLLVEDVVEPAVAACPVGLTCKAITVTGLANGVVRSEIKFLLVP